MEAVSDKSYYETCDTTLRDAICEVYNATL